MTRTIKVTGKGQLSLKPDCVRLLLNQNGLEKDYSKAVELSTLNKNELNDIFTSLGFEKSDLKTLSFNIQSEYESYQDEHNNWKNRFVGYHFYHQMKLELDNDNERLTSILSALSTSKATPELSIEYTVKNQESAKKELLRKAVEDGKEKAEILTSAAGLQLGEIQNIDYSFSDISFVSRTEAMPMMKAMANDEACRFDVEADDIKVNDNVTIIWEIH